MRISFDLDQTLIPVGNEFETEKRNLFQKLFQVERIRKGTINLFKELKSKGHKLSIYTTSYRKTYKIRFSFLTYGLRLEQIINEKKNRKGLSHKNIRASKYLPAFNFDIHIDDLGGLKIEGEKFNFNVIVISTSEIDWIEKIIEIIGK